VWESLEKPDQVRFAQFVEQAPSEEIHNLDDWLIIPPLRAAAIARVRRMTLKEFEENVLLLIFKPDRILINELVSRYVAVRSYDSANAWGKVVSFVSSSLTAEDITRLFEAAETNREISGSFHWQNLASELKGSDAINDATFNTLVTRCGFGELVREPNDEPPF
jgi:hypothetical protein